MFSSTENSSGEFWKRTSALESPAVEFASWFGVSLRKASSAVKSVPSPSRASSVMRSYSEQALNELAQEIHVDRFGHIGVEAGCFRSSAKISLLVCGNGHDRNPSQPVAGADLFGGRPPSAKIMLLVGVNAHDGNPSHPVAGADLFCSRQSIHNRETEIHEDNVRAFALRNLQGHSPVFSLDHQIA